MADDFDNTSRPQRTANDLGDEHQQQEQRPQQEQQQPHRKQQAAIASLQRMSSYALGLVLLLFVVFLWTTSSFLGSSIFADGTYAKPFFLTYLNTSAFILAAAPNFIVAAWRNRRSSEWKAQLAWIRERYQRGGLRLVFTDAKDDEKSDDLEEDLLSHDRDRDRDHAHLEHGEGSSIQISNSSALSAPSPRATGIPTCHRQHLALLPTAKLALQFCPLWFLSNYLASACLQHTSVASTTILTSTSSLWTLALGVLSGTERFTMPKCLSVVVSLVGIVLISRADLSTATGTGTRTDTDNITPRSLSASLSPFPDKSPREIFLGDAMALCSAFVYGYYTIFLKRISTEALPLKINMSLLFGLIGLINTIVLAPVLPLLSVLGIEGGFELPPTSRIWAIVLVNSTASLVADISWAHALVLTSPLVVTVGLSLTIPISLVGEMFLQGRFESVVYWLGSFFVVGSFVFVAREEARDVVKSFPSSDLVDDQHHHAEAGRIS